MMDAEAIQAIVEVVTKIVLPQKVVIDDTKTIVVVNGQTQSYTTPPPRRQHSAEDLSAIVAFAMPVKESPRQASVWYNASAVTCLIDDADRRDAITLKLKLSPQFQKIREWENQSKPMKQADAVLLLRTMFRDCMGPAGNLISLLKNLKFTNNASGEATISQGKASYSSRIDQELTGAGSIPEDFQMDMPVFASGFLSIVRMDLAISIDCPTQTFTLIPLPGGCQRAINAAEMELGASLAASLGDGAKLYYGAP